MRYIIKGTVPLHCTSCGKQLGKTLWECKVAVGSPIEIHPWADICVMHSRESGCAPEAVMAQNINFRIEELH